MLLAEYPIRLENLANKREHWSARAKRAKEQRYVGARLFLGKLRPPLPLVITITRLSSGRMDSDNLAISAKHIRDGIADWLGIDDGHLGLEWRYQQEKCPRGRFAVRAEIKSAAQEEADVRS